jgi:hypothetical protein
MEGEKTMNKRIWMLPKITPQEIHEMFLTDADRLRIKQRGERAAMFISSCYAAAMAFEYRRNGF